MLLTMSTAPSWDGTRLFLALVRAPSLRAATKLLGVDASTASRQLALVEEELGGQLFDRTRQGLVPTALAQRILPSAEAMERAHLQLQTAASARETAIEGSVRITAPPGIASPFVAPLIGELLRAHPKLRVEIVSTTAILDLDRREADLALRLVRPTQGELVMTRLVATREVPMGSRALAKKLGVVRDLSAVPWVGWGALFSRYPFAAWLQERVPDASIVVRSDSVEVQLEAIASGVGVGMLAEQYLHVRPHFSEVKLSRALTGELARAPLGELWMVAHRELRAVPRIAACWDFFAKRLGDAPARPARPTRPTRRRL